MKRIAVLILILIIVLALALAGCAEQRFYVAGYADLIIHRDNPKVLVTSITKCGQVAAWVRLSDAGKMVTVCDESCNCKLVKGTQPPPPDGICR